MTTPKRNEAVAPVAWATPKQMDHFDKVREEGGRDTWADVWLRQREPYTVPLYRASVVETLQGEVSRLREALSVLSEACFAEFCGKETEANEPDDSKVSYPEERCHITFGMIRNARKALNLEPPTDGR